MTAYTIGALSIIGAPPMGGLWSKWMLGMAALEAGEVAMIGVLMLSSLLSIGYLLPVSIYAFFNTPDPQNDGKPVFKEAPALSVAALSFTALGCIALFLFPDPLHHLASLIVAPVN